MTWTTPNISELPSLKGEPIIGLDLETKDPNLKELGPGAIRKDGYVVGVSVATQSGFKRYIPIRHEGGGNCDIEQATRYLRDNLSGNEAKCGANLGYDIEWLFCDLGIKVGGQKLDVQVAEPLLDEDKSTYTLDSLAEYYLNKHKNEDALRLAAKMKLGLEGSAVKGNLWRLPAEDVGDYAEDDADLPIHILAKQRPLLAEQGLEVVFDQETRLIDLLLLMRCKGVPVDLERAFEVKELLTKEFQAVHHRLKQLSMDADFDYNSGQCIAALCDRQGVSYPKTAKGNPSFVKEWLEAQPQELFGLIRKARTLSNMSDNFVQSKIIDVAHKGRIHASFHSVKNEEYGTAGGRFSMSHPNMQQVPKRNKELAKLIRSCFVPEPGQLWSAFDHKQQEVRYALHLAVKMGLRGAEEAREKYVEDPSTDYLNIVAEMAQIARDDAKTINYGLTYGMGKKKLAASLGLDYAAATELSEKFHAAMPYIRPLIDRASQLAKSRGYIKTHLARRKRFQVWGPRKWEEGIRPLPRKEAFECWGNGIVRYSVHKAISAVVQGSCADMMKQNMLDCYDAGYVLPLTVHDELDGTDLNEKQIREVKEIMENSFQLTVPLRVDVKTGKNWGEVKEFK